MFVVDTNILVYAADAEAAEHAVCRQMLETLREGSRAWFLSWNILYELVRVVTHPRVFRTPWQPLHAWAFVRALVASPSCQVLRHTDRHAETAEAFFAEFPETRGNLVHDGHTAILMLEHGIGRICTRDMDFNRFGVEVVAPTVL